MSNNPRGRKNTSNSQQSTLLNQGRSPSNDSLKPSSIDAQPQGRGHRVKHLSTKAQLNLNQKQEQRAALATGIHHGISVSEFVRNTLNVRHTKQGDRAEEVRNKFHNSAREENSLSKLFSNKTQRDFIEARFNNKDVHQDDNRVLSKDGSYKGSMISATYFSLAKNEGDKQTNHPRSPTPKNYEPNRAHATPFRLHGAKTNEFTTVWNPNKANKVVDSEVENAVEHYGKLSAKTNPNPKGNESAERVHFRVDTQDHSTVGFVAKQGQGDDTRYTMYAMNYQRRFDDKFALRSMSPTLLNEDKLKVTKKKVKVVQQQNGAQQQRQNNQPQPTNSNGSAMQAEPSQNNGAQQRGNHFMRIQGQNQGRK